MPWKLLAVLILVAAVIALVGFNAENNSNVSLFGIYTFSEVPIIITIGVSYLVGAFTSILYMFSIQSNKKSKPAVDNKSTVEDASGKSSSEKKRKTWINKKKKSKAGEPPPL